MKRESKGRIREILVEWYSVEFIKLLLLKTGFRLAAGKFLAD